jgi:hypothetical protein
MRPLSHVCSLRLRSQRYCPHANLATETRPATGTTKCQSGGGSNWATDQCAWQKSVSYGSRTDVNHQVPRIIYYQIPPATVAAVRPMSRSSSRSSPIAKNKKSSPSKAKGVEKQISYAVVLKSGIPPTGSRYEYSVRKFASLKGKEECTFLVSHVGVPGQVEQWMLSPVDFYPFWARQIHQGGKIVTLDPP